MDKKKITLSIDLESLFEDAILLFEHTWLKAYGREAAMDWYRLQLAIHGLYTVPCGMSWAVECTKERFEEYMNSLYKIDWKDFRIEKILFPELLIQ